MQLINENATLALSGLSRTTLRRYVAAGKFPAPIKSDGWHIVWQLAEVEAWVLARAVVEGGQNFKAVPALDLVALARSIDPALARRLFPSAADVLKRAA
jgi:prophage regulatory protein